MKVVYYLVENAMRYDLLLKNDSETTTITVNNGN